MVRNANLVGFADQPVPGETNPDTDIHIEGGVWTTDHAKRSKRQPARFLVKAAG